ncbi:MAG: winged helix-turn-helix domain-containing protein, partial [Acidobacteriales bacterium]|nr:winged helix-turn-helix domain-containing protein [Terriglobales bacterium]
MYEFGSFRCEPSEHLLLCEGKPVSLTPKMFDILVAFLRSQGRLLSKDELMRTVWPDSFVEEANLTVNISALRKALGETADRQPYIETVPRRGYRFVVPVREVSEADRASSSPESQGKGQVPPPVSSAGDGAPSVRTHSEEQSSIPVPPGAWRKRALGAGLALVCALAVLVGYRYTHRAVTIQARQTTPPRRLAILPFRNLGQNPKDDFLGLSLADTVITKLGYVSSVTVRPSYAVEKYRANPLDPKKIAQDLDIDTLLAGGFVHEGDNLRITCQLIEVSTENILWKGVFDLKYDKLLSVQDNVAEKIIQGLALSLSPAERERLKPDGPVDPLAYEYYLRGVDLYARSEFQTAIKMLEKSAELSPDYALTWAELGKSYTAGASFQFGGSEYYRRAQAAFERALALQPLQIEARIYMANLFTDTGRVEQAVPLLREALKTNGNHLEVHWELGYAYRFAGMLQDSVREAENARQLDPGVKLNSSTPNAYLYLGQYDKFLEHLPLNRELPLVVFYRGLVEYYRGNFLQAQEHFDRAYELDHTLLQAQIGKAYSYG